MNISDYGVVLRVSGGDCDNIYIRSEVNDYICVYPSGYEGILIRCHTMHVRVEYTELWHVRYYDFKINSSITKAFLNKLRATLLQ